MPEQPQEPDDSAASDGRALVFGDQRGVLQECGVEIAGDASLRPLITIGCQSKRALVVLLTPPNEGPSVDELAPWLGLSSSLVEHMEDQSS